MRGVEHNAIACIHVGACGRDQHRIKARHSTFTIKINGGIGLYGFNFFKQHIIVLEHAALLDNTNRLRPNHNVLAPIMHHGKGEFSIFLDVKLGNTQVQRRHNAMGCGASRDDMHLGIFFNHNDIMNILPDVFALDK